MGIMTDTNSREVAKILRDADGGQPVDMSALMPLVHDRLRAIATRRMEAERPGHTLQATALVNEAYLRLVGDERLAWSSKSHFYAAASEAMRHILIDHARSKGRVKRGGRARRLPLDVLDLAARDDVEEILSVDEAICRLEEQDPRMGKMVRLRFYAGLSEQETAQVLGVSDRTVQREWVLARAWLKRRLGEE
jgi:RNA polymerase sigma factor (TIGR02999 family)